MQRTAMALVRTVHADRADITGRNGISPLPIGPAACSGLRSTNRASRLSVDDLLCCIAPKKSSNPGIAQRAPLEGSIACPGDHGRCWVDHRETDYLARERIRDDETA